ncbi:MAG: hypothetical protein L6R38_002214 [Xanthoria sp. 2 TBL-2021]|nr:MAG: hypothetical protein L6R38_002214 [Xanthoria sp. 2 TBL-2021]
MRLAGTDIDLDLELSLNPVIQELVRTQVCLPNLKLLVHRIVVVTLPGVDELGGNEAFKLTLTDGEKTIQALLKRRIYRTLYNHDIREGSFVILKVYHLAQGKRIQGNGTITYLVIEDFFSIGEDDRYHVASETQETPDLAAGGSGLTESSKHLPTSITVQELPTPEMAVDHQDPKLLQYLDKENVTPTPPSSQQLREAMKRKWDTALDEIDTNDTHRISKYRKLEETRAKEAQQAAVAAAKALLVRFESLPTTPLVAVTGSNKRRNTCHDILALIVSISPDTVKRANMPSKRDLRIMDISTTKKVLLSVFAKAEVFHPQPGTVALFKHLTTHDYDGGSLNAYAKDCSSPDWFVPDPPGFENGEVAQLKDCWARLQYSEQVALESNVAPSQVYEPLDIPEEEDIADHLPAVSGKKHLTCFYWAKNGICRYTSDECAYAHYNTGIVAQDPMHGQNITTEKESNAKDLSGLPPSRSLTCFFWARNRKCNRSDEECSYAHYDTGTIARAPPGVTVFEPSLAVETSPPTKPLTCYFWNRDGRCSRSDAECKYAHHATGTVAYPPPTVVASTIISHNNLRPSSGTGSAAVQPAAPSPALGGKSLTCFFWARNGHCTRSDAECRYAHYDTGTVANNPSQPFATEPAQYKLSNTPVMNDAIPSVARLPATAPGTSGTSISAPTSATLATPQVPAPPPTIIETPILPDTTSAIPITNDAGAVKSSFPSVKHLTCYFWANYGRCKRSDEECNYAHFHTGRVAGNPMEFRKVKRT